MREQLTQKLVDTLADIHARLSKFDVFICLYIIEQALKEAKNEGFIPGLNRN